MDNIYIDMLLPKLCCLLQVRVLNSFTVDHRVQVRFFAYSTWMHSNEWNVLYSPYSRCNMVELRDDPAAAHRYPGIIMSNTDLVSYVRTIDIHVVLLDRVSVATEQERPE